jgi:hypothetical protein
MKFTENQQKAIEVIIRDKLTDQHYPGWIAGDSHSTCRCGWNFNFGLAEPTYVSTPEHKRHVDECVDKLLASPKLEVLYELYLTLAPYLEAFKASERV